MADEKEKETTKKAKAEPLIRLRAATEWDGELAIGEARYPVTAGVVEVPVRHLPGAEQAGFRRA
jgi:hypothetical protein